MALTQGIFARMIADSAPEHLRATSFGAFWFVTGIATLLASLGAGWLWDRDGAQATFLTSAGVAARRAGDAQPSCSGPSRPCPITTGSPCGALNGGIRADPRQLIDELMLQRGAEVQDDQQR